VDNKLQQQYTILKDDFKIFCIKSMNTIFEPQYNGLNVKNRENIFGQDIKHFDKHFNIVMIHGYDLVKNNFNNIKNIFNKNVSLECDDFVIDMYGERADTGRLDEWDSILEQSNIKYKRKRIISTVDDFPFDKKGWEFFTYPFSGPRFYCHPYMSEFQNVWPVNTEDKNIVFGGVKWNSEKKDKLFTCLNGDMGIHRITMVYNLLKSDVFDLGYVSSNPSTVEEIGISVPDLKIEGDAFYKHKTDIQRFRPNPFFMRNSYIDIVTWSGSPQYLVCDEKSVKPFLGTQFPILYGYHGTVQYFRDFGFDMFDDIINHSYDKLDMSKWGNRHKQMIKSKMIVKELERLSKLDIHKIYLDCKDRLIKNKELMIELCYTNNKRNESMVKWLFGDNATYYSNPNFVCEEI
jgi:hypothetical protein